jgi:saccharopine dehydrogenase-like NADP-dependent oxidoreductase
MNAHYNIIIAGAGGIAQAAGLLLAEWSKVSPTIYLGNRTLSKAENVAKWIEDGATKSVDVRPFLLQEKGINEEMKTIFKKGDVLLDCLPGSLAPKMAQYAKDFELHYANLTEYVAETSAIVKLAKDATTGFVLQTGLAPGYINVLANHLFQNFCSDFEVVKVDTLEMKVGALTDHAVAPHFYGFTWSPVGVATEYIKDAVVVRNHKKINLPALSEKRNIIIDGVSYEEDLTSGGAADLPDALATKVCSLDYKTLRHPGHYAWVLQQIANFVPSTDLIQDLQQRMEEEIPHIENDQIILYAAVTGKDKDGVLRRREISKKIKPVKVGKHVLRAIQTTTAVPMLQAAQYLLENSPKGVILQSELNTNQFLSGGFVQKIYGDF